MTSEIDKLSYGLLCNIVVLKVIFGYLNPYYRSAYNVSKRRK